MPRIELLDFFCADFNRSSSTLTSYERSLRMTSTVSPALMTATSIEPEAGKSPLSGIARGREEVAEFFRILDEVAETEAFEPREYVAEGDKVVVLGRYRYRVRTSGKDWEAEWAMAFTFRDGRISHFRFYGDTAAEAAAFA